MELAAYDLLARLAERADDSATTLTAQMIAKDERAMSQRLANSFDRAVEASLRERDVQDVGKQLAKYLANAHAIEQQAARLLKGASKMAGADELVNAFEEHLEETREHSQLLERRLSARGARRSMLQDAALQFGALNIGMLLGAQVDSAVKHAAFAYTFEHLEIASYELLKRVASRVGDVETIATADEILLQERAAAARIQDLFDHALVASLESAGVKA